MTGTNVYSLAALGTDLFAGTNQGGVVHSYDGGRTWNWSNTGMQISQGGTYPNVMCFATKGVNLFAGTDSGVFSSTDNGTNWVPANSGLTTRVVRSLVVGGMASRTPCTHKLLEPR